MNYRLVHRTTYTYGGKAELCHNEARLTPRALQGQQCADSRIEIAPQPSVRHERRDYFGNRVCYFSIRQPHDRLEVTAVSRVQRQAPPPTFDFGDGTSWEEARRRLWHDKDPVLAEARLFALDSPLVVVGEALAEYAAPSFASGRPLAEAALDLMRRIYRDFDFDPASTTVSTPLAEVLEKRRGVCQDFAHLAIGCVRSLGLAARYVSGYIETLPPPGKERLVGADASHAWFAVYLPGTGWADFDPTNDQMPGERHITVAWGRDYGDATPLKGVVFGGGGHKLDVSVDMAPEGDGGT